MDNDDILLYERELSEDLTLLGRDIGSMEKQMPMPHLIRAIIAPILRKWIVEEGLAKLHKHAGAQSHYTVYDNTPAIRLCQNDILNIWFGLLPVMGTFVSTRKAVDPAMSSRITYKAVNQIRLSFKNFRKQKMAFNEQRFITREDCIRFMANKLGGSHSQSMAKIKKNDPVNFLELTRFALGENGYMKILEGDRKTIDPQHEKKGLVIYNLMHLIVLDTARRFYNGIQNIN